MFLEPELSFRPRLDRFAEGFLRDHLGSLECRERSFRLSEQNFRVDK